MTPRGRPRLRIGISSCLLGQEVRYDGGHKRDRWITETLGGVFEWVPVCPEVELGLGVPRDTLRLEGTADAPRLVFADSRRDVTARMRAWSRRRLKRLEALDLCGFILKSDSPSCGLERVRLHPPGSDGPAARRGIGLFARALKDRFPLLPVVEERRLHDPALRDRFVERVFRYGRTRTFVAPCRRDRPTAART
jgi:uncharacterized protein YbbK (DUF523 family)